MSNVDIVSIQINIESNQWHTSTNGSYPSSWVNLTISVIRCPILFQQFFWHAFELSFTDFGQVLTFWACGRIFIKEDWDSKFTVNPFCDLFGNLNTFLCSDVFDRNEWADIGCSHTRVFTMMFGHINVFRSVFHQLESCFLNRLVISNQGKHAPVVARIRRVVEKGHSRNTFGRRYQTIDNSLILAF